MKGTGHGKDPKQSRAYETAISSHPVNRIAVRPINSGWPSLQGLFHVTCSWLTWNRKTAQPTRIFQILSRVDYVEIQKADLLYPSYVALVEPLRGADSLIRRLSGSSGEREW